MRKIYFKIKKECRISVASLLYTYKDIDGNIQPFNSIFVDFKEDEISIKKMESVKQEYGSSFMFFNNSDKGIEFWKGDNTLITFPKD